MSAKKQKEVQNRGLLVRAPAKINLSLLNNIQLDINRCRKSVLMVKKEDNFWVCSSNCVNGHNGFAA
jgi:hypothetical protein